MVEKLGGTRAILAYALVGAFIAGCFVTGMSDVKFTALGTLATTGVVFYFSNKATLDKPVDK
jgi:hypothetical protein